MVCKSCLLFVAHHGLLKSVPSGHIVLGTCLCLEMLFQQKIGVLRGISCKGGLVFFGGLVIGLWLHHEERCAEPHTYVLEEICPTNTADLQNLRSSFCAWMACFYPCTPPSRVELCVMWGSDAAGITQDLKISVS